MRGRGTTGSSAPGTWETRETRETREGAHAKTRLVIRRLPPGLTSSAFHDALASCPASCPCEFESVEFVAGSESKAYMGSSRAYVTLAGREGGAGAPSGNVPSQASADVSAQKFKQWVEGDGNTGVFGNAVVVGYAAYRPRVDPDEDQAGGGGEVGKVNDLDGTLEGSEVFKEFMEQFEREKKEQEEGGKPVTQPLEIRGEVRKTSLMEFVERQFRKNQRSKTRKGQNGKGMVQGRVGGAAKGGQGGQARGAGQQQKGVPSSKARSRGGRGEGGQKSRIGRGSAAQRAGPVSSKDSSAPADRQGKAQSKGQLPGQLPGQSQASASGKNPRTANAASGDSNPKPRGTNAQRHGKKGVKAAGGAAPKAAASINILNPNAASFA